MTKDLTNGLVLDLDIETLQDYSGNGNDGTATGTTLTTDKDGRYNKARSFNGSSDYIALSSLTAGTEGSLRIKINSTQTSQSIPYGWNNSDSSQIFRIRLNTDGNDGKTEFIARSSVGNQKFGVFTDTSLNDGNEHIIHWVWSASILKGYIDGVEQTVTDTSAGTQANFTATPYIGARNNNGSASLFYSGNLNNNIEQWNRALSAEEVQQDYAEIKHNYQGLFDGLVAGYDFKKDAKDFSGNGNDGTVSGATLTTDHLGIQAAYDFNGSSDYVAVSNLDIDAPITICFWYKADVLATSGSYQSFFRWADGSGRNTSNFDIQTYYGGYANDQIWFRVYDTPINSTITREVDYTNSSVSDLNWHFISLVIEDNNFELYFDGILVDNNTNSGTVRDNNNADFIIASRYSGDENFNGKITQPLIFNVAKTADQVKQLYDLTKSGYIYPYPQQRQGGITE